MKKLSLLALALVSTTAFAAAVPAGALLSKRLHGKGGKHGDFDIKYVQLSEKVGTPAVRKAVNKKLAAIAKESLCDMDPEWKNGMYSNLMMSGTFLNRRLLGLEYSYDNFCGGAHPNDGVTGLTYDLRTGKEVQVEAEVRDQAALRRLVVEKIIANMPADTDEQCKEFFTNEELTAGYYDYALQPTGLRVTPDFPHVIRACEYDTVIPYADLLPLLKEGSALEAVSK